jgi:hypothetical protein
MAHRASVFSGWPRRRSQVDYAVLTSTDFLTPTTGADRRLRRAQSTTDGLRLSYGRGCLPFSAVR